MHAPSGYSTMNTVFHFFRRNHILAACENAIERKSFTLNLSRFEMTDVPDLLGRCELLLKLFMNHNYLVKVPPEIVNLTRLQVLTLDYNELDEFPLAVCSLPNLRTLNVSCNNITAIPAEIGNLAQLETFWCNNSGLLELPEEIGNCTQLETLGVRGHKLQCLPASIGLLTNLRWLTVEGNEITALPATFAALQKLVHLNLKYNHLTEMPRCLSEMKELQFVFLTSNRIDQMPSAEALNETRFMRMLNLIDNPISNDETTKQLLKVHPHILYDKPDVNYEEDVFNQHFNAPILDEEDDELDDGDYSDWENSIVTSDLDTTDDSEPDHDMEDISMLIPTLSRYVINFS